MTFFTRATAKQALIAALAVILVGLPSVHCAAQEPETQIASVNDQVIYRQDLNREMKLVSLKLARQGRPVDDA